MSAVPFFTFHKNAALVDASSMDADAAGLAGKVRQHFGAPPPAASALAAAAAAAPAAAAGAAAEPRRAPQAAHDEARPSCSS